jgi:predicted small lipoprotein YifL
MAGRRGGPMRPILLALILTLAACGQAGELYLPDQKPAAEADGGVAQDAATEEDKDKK